MTDQQPHTPNVSDFREDFVTACVQSRWLSSDGARQYFDRELTAIEAAAEQRGAEETLAYLIEDYPAYASHEEIRAWIQARLDHVRNADQIGGKICGLDGCESDEIAGHMQDGTLICYDCAREGEMEGGE